MVHDVPRTVSSAVGKKMKTACRSLDVPTLLLLVSILGGCGTTKLGSSVSQVDSVFLAAAGSWDRNKDGIVTCDEWKAYAAELLQGADKNRDGFLDRAEFETLLRTDKMFETADFSYFDANRDSRVDRAEFVDRPNPAFLIADRSKECKLNADQLTAARSLTEQVPVVTPPAEDKQGPIGR